MKNPKIKYYAHEGQTATRDGRTGIICGWDQTKDDSALIMAVTEGKGWVIPKVLITDLHIITHANNKKGYYYVKVKHILKESK